MEQKTIQVYSEKENKMIDIEVIGKGEKKGTPGVMLVVDEEE